VAAVGHHKLSALGVVVIVLVLSAVFAGGPLMWALAVMGLPFIALFLMLGGVAHGHVDNGHFRTPDTQPVPYVKPPVSP
jgi:hypothetical protein